MHGSKYVQSLVTPDVFRSIRSVLQSGKTVLFSGTPCQVAGLRSFLKVDYSHLLTVDVPCYGVPSPMFFEQHIRAYEKKYKGRIVNFSFRDKHKNGFSHTTVFTIEKDGGRIIKRTIDDYRLVPYHYAFGKCDCFDTICYRCPYAQIERVADITLGSFWRIEELNDTFSTRDGVSMILPNSPKGEKWFEYASKKMTLSEHSVDEAVARNAGLVSTKPLPSTRDDLYASLRGSGYHHAMKLFYRVPMWRKAYAYAPILHAVKKLFFD
nr:Coenzyme F420 hydrogenase/dehydrogenase, beta subunit C-terminal domain [Eggerthella guodeyinii]